MGGLTRASAQTCLEQATAQVPCKSDLIARSQFRKCGQKYITCGRASDLPNDLAYEIVKAVFENQSRFVKAHPAASETILRNVDKNTFMPFHPGAIRYYREIGIKIPDALVSTN